jgi:hypothetical protein
LRLHPESGPAPALCGVEATVTARPQLVHITADLPDRVRSAGKTTAVARLLDTADWATHRVYSLNRVVTPWYSHDLAPDENGVVSA